MLLNGEKIPINDNERLLKEPSISMNRLPSKAKLCSNMEAESGATRLSRLLDAPECRLFFMKCMYHLPYTTREQILEYALKPWVKAPKRYFTHCAKKELTKLGF